MTQMSLRSAHKFKSVRAHCPGCGLNLGKEREVCPHCGMHVACLKLKYSFVYHCSGCGCIVGSEDIVCSNGKCLADLRGEA